MNKQPAIEVSEDKMVMKLHNIEVFEDIIHKIIWETGMEFSEINQVQQLVLCGCAMDGFNFLREMRCLTKLALVECGSMNWGDLRGDTVRSLRLHNLKEGRRYLTNIDFLHAFPMLEYLYLNMLGLAKCLIFPICVIFIQ